MPNPKIKVIYSENLQGLISELNHLSITKDDIIHIGYHDIYWHAIYQVNEQA